MPDTARLVPCPDCAHMISHRAASCPECGAPIQRPQPPPIPKRAMRLWKNQIFGGGCVSLAGVGLLVLVQAMTRTGYMPDGRDSLFGLLVACTWIVVGLRIAIYAVVRHA